MNVRNREFETMGMASWRKTNRKIYSMWACAPGVGVVVHNNMDNTDYITTKDKPIVISGVTGEKKTIELMRFVRACTFANGEEITPTTLARRLSADRNNGWIKVKTRQSGIIQFAMILPLNKYRNVEIMTSSGAVHIANGPGVKHGEGDYIMCSSTLNGTPNTKDMWIVNGRVFVCAYNLQHMDASAAAINASEKEPPLPDRLV